MYIKIVLLICLTNYVYKYTKPQFGHLFHLFTHYITNLQYIEISILRTCFPLPSIKISRYNKLFLICPVVNRRKWNILIV